MLTIGLRRRVNRTDWLAAVNETASEEMVATNELLRALGEAGVPLALGCNAEEIGAELQRIDTSLSLRSRLGQQLPAALATNEDLPQQYRSAMLVALQSGRWSLALESLSQAARVRSEMRKSVGIGLWLPMIVLVLAYFAFIGLCLGFSPTVDGLYEQTGEPLSLSASLLSTAHHWMGVWVPAVPLLLLVVWYMWRRFRFLPVKYLPGARRFQSVVSQATFADHLARLVQAGTDWPTAIELASQSTGDQGLVESCAEYVAVEESSARELQQRDANTDRGGLPPLLRWALSSGCDQATRVGMLQLAAETYHMRAGHLAGYLRNSIPTILGALVAGVIVLLYGLSVFGTMAQLLRDLAT